MGHDDFPDAEANIGRYANYLNTMVLDKVKYKNKSKCGVRFQRNKFTHDTNENNSYKLYKRNERSTKKWKRGMMGSICNQLRPKT